MEEVLLTECDSIKAQLIAQILDDNGIDNRVEEVKTVAEATYGVAAHMSRIFVAPEDIDKAKNFIHDMEKSGDGEMTWCPKCGSENLERNVVTQPPRWIKITVYILLLLCLITPIVSHIILKNDAIILIPGGLGVAFIIYYFTQRNKKGSRCKDCGHTFSNY